MTRLELLKNELEIVKGLRCIRFDVKEQAVKHYIHEIKCIEEHGSDNREVTE